MVVDDFVEPNGLALSPDEKKRYVIDTGFTDGPDNPSRIRVFDVDARAGKLSNSKVFAEMPKPAISDGVRCDTDGRVWCSVGWGDPNEDGVRCYTPSGDLLGKIHIPETVANRKLSPTCASAACNEIGSTFAARHRSMPSTRVCRAY
jgi:gluconolactonase